MRVGLPDRDIVRLVAGDPAEIVFDAYPGRAWAGRVTWLGSAAAPAAGTFEAELRLVQPEGGRFAQGMLGRVSLAMRRAARPASFP